MDIISASIDEECSSIFGDNIDVPIYISKKYQKYHTLVLSGGGIKGISHIGVLKVLEEYKYIQHIKHFIGTSIGALIACLYIIGYSVDQLKQFAIEFKFEKLTKKSFVGIVTQYGMDNGERLILVVKKMLIKKGFNPEITLLELFQKTQKTLTLTTSCLNTCEPCYLSYKNFPNLPLYLAIRMSTAIPLYFTPIEYEGKTYIDGGCLDNYSIALMKCDLSHTLGVNLQDKLKYSEKISSIENYFSRVFSCIQLGMSENAQKGYEKYTISIQTTECGLADFNISTEQKLLLFQQGYEKTKIFLD